MMRRYAMTLTKQLITSSLAFIAFTLLPVLFWAGLTYAVINEDAAKAVAILFGITGMYTCYRGRKNNYHWFNKCKS